MSRLVEFTHADTGVKLLVNPDTVVAVLERTIEGGELDGRKITAIHVTGAAEFFLVTEPYDEVRNTLRKARPASS